MAKSSFWLRGAKGKLAGATIYDANGQSVMREVKAHIKNPRTKAQMIQRVISKTVMNQYAAMKAIVNHSFQGKTAGAKSMAYFASINNRATRSFVAEMQNAGIALSEIYNFIPCKSVKFVPARSIISEGTLPQIYATIASDGSKASVALQGVDNTYEAVINTLGLQRGDQLTFVTTEKNDNGDYKFDFCRVILDPREADGTAAPLSTPFIADGAVVKPSFRNEGDFAALTFAAGALGFSVSGGVVATAGVIASRQIDNDWLRSACELAFNEAALGEDICSLENAVYLSTAKTPVYTDSERYLNNAGVGGPQAGSEASTPIVSKVNNVDVVDGAVTLQDYTDAFLLTGTGLTGTISVENAQGQAVEITETETSEDGTSCSILFSDDVSGTNVVKIDGVTVVTVTISA
jgi:hypothetical protein